MEEEEEEEEEMEEDKEEEEVEEHLASEDSYAMEEILDESPDESNTEMLFLVKWQGYSHDFNSWVSYKELPTCLKVFNRYFLKKHSTVAKAPAALKKHHK